VALRNASCEGSHGVEVAWVGRVAEVENLDVAPSSPDDFTDAGASFLICTALMAADDVAAFGDQVEYQYVTEDAEPDQGDSALCFATPADGSTFT
jgi:hypothetical protein